MTDRKIDVGIWRTQRAIKRKRPKHPYFDQIQINNINPKMMAVGEGFEPPRSS